MGTLVTLPNGSRVLVDAGRDRREQVCMLIGFFVESFLYGIYVILFSGVIYLTLKRRRNQRGRGAKIVFAFVSLLMFLITSTFTGINVYRFVESYALVKAPLDTPIYFFRDFKRWENYAYVVCSSLLIWIADVLVIYRCYVVWERNWRVIAVPVILLLVSISTNAVNIYWFQSPALPFQAVKPLLDFVYPGHLAQNILTTALIAYKMWKQHRESQASGLRPAFTTALLSVIWIIVGSALIYTLELTTLVVLYFMHHPAEVILQAAIVPSIGIVIILPGWIHETELKDDDGSRRSSFVGLVQREMDYIERTSRAVRGTL
ncbi:hypothetical protein FA13DRAFT_1235401 [Coprinellus micaceus]|uniref:Uncharacterized protein n=1 Tax=Coprinellus micaceus TaxID=71717 RepID=A0A4Y7TPU9_COPMI|nr:hypothetical protein FA13DRAFT_1235401 [Coprinellus micaceus]